MNREGEQIETRCECDGQSATVLEDHGDQLYLECDDCGARFTEDGHSQEEEE